MIIVRLQGGLGNQLFQYAAGKSLATALNKPFKLETITSLQKDKRRSIALDDFDLEFELASLKEVREFVHFPTLYRHPFSLLKTGKNIYREPHFHFDSHFFELKDPVFLDGFWQSPQYFREIEDILRRDLIPKSNLIQNVLVKGKELQNKPSVAVHIRRGDFLDAKINAYHGVLSAIYYEKAMGFIKEKEPNACFYFFSDDIEWVKQNLATDKNAEFVSSFTKSPVEDFYLMTKCRHNIIANSSFSWWTAWLNDNPGKIVVAPKRWFAISTIDTNDLMPADWNRFD